ncbi:TlpA family protein disulfide reductase [Neolewinella aurantiaca]|uniref:TlpA family protein disulfide reductase n=1 Tax=Neolewinella aurantiaca TaxID=2602767 RepID=A0A5C7FMI5_9BACT|nr:TlpA disulfide reductase family protein [Neolewinella aurantiaca]TXF91280.1 TlpA family protein disulfide reductase [Neolewinella aurantiaca]
MCSRTIFRFLTTVFLPLVLFSCTFVQDRYPTLPPGPYRAVLELEYNPIVPNPKGAPIPEKTNLEFDEVTNGALPFNMDVVYVNDTTFRIDVHNGEEVITIPPQNIQTGRDRAQGRDTIRIEFPVYDAYISAYFEEKVIEGVYVVNYRDNYRIPFKAFHGQDHRFTVLRKEPAADISGTWAVMFGKEDETPYPGIAEFKQNGNYLSGTFRTETGDYRFLEGTVQANKAYLSVFDGAHLFLFEALIKEDGTLSGTFRSGRHYLTNWTAKRDPDFVLKSPDELTLMNEDIPLSFSFPKADGTTVSLNDPAYNGKPKLIKIMGTWCPNCREEADFLKEYLANNDTRDLEVIALAFEQYGADDERSWAAVRRYEENMQVPWPVLLAGPSDKEAALNALPMLNKIISYPTLLFVDRNNKVKRIYTGFNGKATSKFEAFEQSFKASVAELIVSDNAE